MEMRTETIEHIVRKPTQRTHETPLFMMHGAWHGAWCWAQFMDYFAALGYETHAISLPGHGESSMNKGHINKYNLQDYVDCMAAELAEVSPTPVIIGHSLGGGIVQKYLETASTPGAVLLASLPVGGMLSMTLRCIWRHFRAMLKVALSANYYYLVETPELARAHFLSLNTEIDLPAFHTQLVRETMNLGTILRLHFAPNFRSDRVRTPVLVLAADNDALFSVEEQRRTAEALHTKCIVFEGQAHNLMIEPAWRQVAGTIDHWINEELHLP